ncbi:DMT family transporter [uncultured Hoeflea sp.]|uniref:DMT family transporter n=1 Tax=uncultured Hoeflea sp. TaxID=538666 RepID=UPI0026282880|nr:DMT family transporter [uncultured Hoeflea sp.]
MIKPNAASGITLALVCLSILAVMPVISNSRPEGFGALSFAFHLSLWQSMFAVPLLFWEWRRGERGVFAAGLDRRGVVRSLAVALATGAMFGLSTYLYVLGVEKAGAVSAAVAIQSYPLFAILWETLFLKRRKTPVELGLTAVLIGALYYLGTGGTLRVDGVSIWFLVSLGVPFLWSIAHVVIKEEFGRTPITPAQVTFFRVTISTLFLAVALAIVEPEGFSAGVMRSELLIFAVIMGLVYYTELIVWFYAVRHIDVSLASSITTPWPAFTMVLAAVVLGDQIALYQVLAFAVVALSIYGLTLAGLDKARAAGEAKVQELNGTKAD